MRAVPRPSPQPHRRRRSRRRPSPSRAAAAGARVPARSRRPCPPGPAHPSRTPGAPRRLLPRGPARRSPRTRRREAGRKPRPPAPADPPAPPRGLRLPALSGARLLAWTGGAVTLLGVVLLMVLAASRGWFSPGARVAAGAVLGVALVALALRLHRRENARTGALALAGTGFATLYLVVAAATAIYELLPSFAAVLDRAPGGGGWPRAGRPLAQRAARSRCRRRRRATGARPRGGLAARGARARAAGRGRAGGVAPAVVAGRRAGRGRAGALRRVGRGPRRRPPRSALGGRRRARGRSRRGGAAGAAAARPAGRDARGRRAGAGAGGGTGARGLGAEPRWRRAPRSRLPRSRPSPRWTG